MADFERIKVYGPLTSTDPKRLGILCFLFVLDTRATAKNCSAASAYLTWISHHFLVV